MAKSTGCLICAQELVYEEMSRSVQCNICDVSHTTRCACSSGHFICDRCHGDLANDWIETVYLHTEETDPACPGSGMATM